MGDGVDVWPVLMDPEGHAAPDAAHAHLVLSKEVLVAGRYKLLVAQPFFKSQNNGWKQPDGKWIASRDEEWPCNSQDAPPGKSALPVPPAGKAPCLFDLRKDPGEHVDISRSNPDLVRQLWAALNASVLATRDCNGWTRKPIPGPEGSCSPPDLLGPCNEACAHAKWKVYGNDDGPICGVPGCGKETSIMVV